MSAIGTGLRWLLVPVSAVAVVALAISGARFGIAFFDARCAAESMVGGTCVAAWHTGALEAVIYAATIAAVLGLVTIPALIAPQLKRTVAIVLFGAAVAIFAALWLLTSWAEILRPLAVTVITGGLALWWMWSSRGRHERL